MAIDEEKAVPALLLTVCTLGWALLYWLVISVPPLAVRWADADGFTRPQAFLVASSRLAHEHVLLLFLPLFVVTLTTLLWLLLALRGNETPAPKAP